MDETTRDYYQKNAADYFRTTKDGIVPITLEHFLSLLPPKAAILDLGCGSGRDTRYFLERGFVVDALDGCEELAAFAEAYIGQKVILCDYFSYFPQHSYDGIWSQASLVHLKREEMPLILSRIEAWLKEDGVAVISLRYGDFEGYRDGRYYTYWTEETLGSLLANTSFQMEKVYLTKDVRPGFQNDWMNVVLRKQAK